MDIYDAVDELDFDYIQEDLLRIQRGKHYTHEEALEVAKRAAKSARSMADLLEAAAEKG